MPELSKYTNVGVLNSTDIFVVDRNEKTVNGTLPNFATVDVRDYGAKGDGVTDNIAALEAAITYIQSTGTYGNISIVGTIGVSRTVNFPDKVCIDCTFGTIIALPGFSANTPVLKFGNSASDPAGRWTGCSPKISVDCGSQHIIGVEYSRPWGLGLCTIDSTIVNKTTYIGIQVTSGYGLYLVSHNVNAPSILTGDGSNAGTDSIGLLVNTSDCFFGPGESFGVFIGVKALGNNNQFVGIHPFGVYQKAGVPQSCPMGICIWNEGEANAYVNCIADSPSLVNYLLSASETNGGYGFYNKNNGYRVRFTNCTVFVANRAGFGESMPTNKLVGYQLNQSTVLIGADVNDDTHGAIADSYTGGAFDSSIIIAQKDSFYYSVNQPFWKRKPWFGKGIEFQSTTTFQDADERADNFGACSFVLDDDIWLRINGNYNGIKKQARIERTRFGDATVRTYLEGILTSDDINYTFYQTNTSKFIIWQGTKFVHPDGTDA